MAFARGRPSLLLPGLVSRACCWRHPASRHPRRDESTLTRIPASSKAERQAPTPLLLTTVSKLAKERPPDEQWRKWTSYFSEKGWECLVLDVDLPPDTQSSAKTGEQVLKSLEREMVKTLRQAPGGVPFPPVLISRGWLGGLVAQEYASSHSLSALCLFDPAISSSRAHADHADVLPTEVAEPNFEPRFPLRVVWSAAEMEAQKKRGVSWMEVHRIEHELEEESGEALDRVVWNDPDTDGPKDMHQWLEDEVGLRDEQGLNRASDVGLTEDDDIELDEDDAIELNEDLHETDSVHSLATQADGLPEWLTKGDYSFNPSGSKKHPLLLDPSHLRERFIRGSGPGGQAINKLSTCVELVHEPTGTRIVCQETRSRELNRELARRRMSVALEDLIKGGKGSVKSSKAEKERKKKRNKAKKQKRRRKEDEAASGPSEEDDP